MLMSQMDHMGRTNNNPPSDLTNQQSSSIFPVQLGGEGNNYGRTRLWWLPTLLFFFIVTIALLSLSWIYPSQFHIVLIGYASIAGAIAFHLYSNGFSVFAMGISMESRRIILLGQEIIGNAVWAIVGTGFLIVAAFIWLLKQGEIFTTIGNSAQGQLEILASVSHTIAHFDSQWSLLFISARLFTFIGNTIFLWGLYRHSHCSRWYNEVYEVFEKKIQENKSTPWGHLT